MQDIDPSILSEFRAESNSLLVELGAVVERLEEVQGEFPEELLKEFALKIDRIMGASKTIGLMAPDHLGFKAMGTLAELCKSMGYKAAEKKDARLMPFFAAFWADTLEVIGDLMKNLENLEKTKEIAGSFQAVLQKRLVWLKSKIDAPPA